VIDLAAIIGFDWDLGNARTYEKHGVSMAEAEQVFFNRPLLLVVDEKHSQVEPRFHVLGRTHLGRGLHLAVTLRGGDSLIRVISARHMHRKERDIYERQAETDPDVWIRS
jgi:uncharacterized DUF497 family protein